MKTPSLYCGGVFLFPYETQTLIYNTINTSLLYHYADLPSLHGQLTPMRIF